MFTLLALLTCFWGVKAEEVVDAEIHFSDVTEVSLGWGAFVEGSTLDIQDGYLHYSSPGLPEGGNPWDTQFTLAALGGIAIEVGETYTLELKIKGSVEGNFQNIGFAGGNPYGNPHVTTDWNVVKMVYENATSDNSNPLIQCGNWAGEWWIEYIKITHEARPNQKPKEWLELITADGTPEGKWMGDAETPWGDLANVKFTETDKTIYVSAWGKEKGVNMNDDGGWDPFPATIETDPDDASNHVFVVHGKAATTEGDASAWDNQFWIMSTKELKVGERYKFHFRYKASEAANTNTQMHSAQPSDYLHYQVLGDVAFTTEWQEFDKEVVIPTPQNNRPIYSIAFNLNPANKNAVDFYFDDLSIQELKLDHGWFVASSNEANGVNYDFDNAIEFEPDPEDPDVVVATVGTVGKKDTWVDKVMISTVRGYDGSFKANTIKVNGTIENDPDVWPYWEESGQTVIKLPAAGVWQISIDISENRQINFVKLEGEEDKQPIEINPNPTVYTVNAGERDDMADADIDYDGVVDIIEEEGGTGQNYNNQMFIKANRVLEAGEETVIEFDYVATKDAKVSTQCHAQPGGYIHWSAIGDVNFTTSEQHFSLDFTIPKECAGKNMQTIAFNMSEIKAANDYTIKNVVWKLKDNTESLIDQEGDANFSKNEFDYPTGISNVVNDNKVSNVIYNLAGQRVSKDFKGLVIKNGAKYIAK